ncbi:MAG: hypothetical protein ABSE89_04135 [Sedimentisphaerales bacterium]
MPITFHCECCKKKVTAKDTSGGKWGKCPYCNHKCYIPSVRGPDEEELTLAPIDDEEEKKYENMMREARGLKDELLHQAKGPPEPEDDKIDDRQLTILVIKYLRQMADGQGKDAQETADKIIPFKGQTKAILEKILLAEKPEPELADVPKKVLTGFVRNILTKIG